MDEIKRGQIYLTVLNGTGCEQKGKRPVLIIQNNVGNKYSPTTIVVPVSSCNKKNNLPVHVKISNRKLYKRSIALCEQIQVIDKSRFLRKLCTISEKELHEINKALKISIGLDD